MRTRSLLVLAVAVGATVVAAATAAAEKATVVRGGNMVLRFNGDVSPERLPKGRMAPVKLWLSGNISTRDGSHPPAARRLVIDFDKQGTINARGLAKCRSGLLQSRDTRSVKKACRKAIVGKGRTTVQVDFPEQRPFRSHGPLVVFNGGVRKGVTTMFIHAYVNVPAPTAIVTTVKVKKVRKGPFGTRAVARIPKIAGGAGSVLKFQLAIKRMFRRGGDRQSYLIARCAKRRLRAQATVHFDDGARLSGGIVRRCKPRG